MTAWHEDEQFWSTFGPALLEGDPERIQARVDGFVDLSRLPKGGRVLDLGCGHGRYSLALARMGFAVTAVDLSAHRLRRLREVAAAEHLSLEIVRRDLRTFTRPKHFHAILWSGDAVGLFDHDIEVEVLAGLLRTLKPGGRLVVAPRAKELAGRDFVAQRWQWLDGDTLILEDRIIDDGFESVRVRFTRVRKGRVTHAEGAWRLWSGSELRRALRRAGFDRVRLFGGFERVRYDADAKGLVAVAER